MLRRLFETGFIIGMFGLVSNAISYYLSVPAGVIVYGIIAAVTLIVLNKFDEKENK